MKKKVVVTGIGLVTSLGADLDSFWSALLEGRSGLTPVSSFDTSQYKVHLGGEVTDFSIAGVEANLDLAQVGRASQFAIVASRRALADAGIDLKQVDHARHGLGLVGNVEVGGQQYAGLGLDAREHAQSLVQARAPCGVDGRAIGLVERRLEDERQPGPPRDLNERVRHAQRVRFALEHVRPRDQQQRLAAA